MDKKQCLRMERWWRAFFLLLPLALVAVSCAPRAYRPPSDKVVYREEGVASWYGSKFHGRRTSSGERYDMYALTAAHRTLPLGTIVRVTRTSNGRSIVLKVNDRGPFIDNRIIDLSYGAARRLRMVEDGLASVVVEAFDGGPGTPAYRGTPAVFSLQVGSFIDRKNAEILKESLSRDFSPVEISPFRDRNRTHFRVRTGRYSSEKEALQATGALESRGYRPFVIREN
jgi:rare lipoprotein A